MLAVRCGLLVVGFAFASSQAAVSFAQELGWQQGPSVGSLGRIAEVQVPEGYVFLEGNDTRTLLELMQNPTSGQELGTLASASEEEDWWVFFEFDEVGYVKDDDRDDLDADVLLKSIRQGTEHSNDERRRRGWATIEVVGWEVSPRYDPTTNNLEWAILGRSEGVDSVNHNTRLLGRRGVMEVSLVCGPEQLDATLPIVHELLEGFSYREGNRYAEFTSGDKVAEYGLMGLVAGGGLALAAKTGLLQKFWKLIVVGFVAIGVFFKKLFGGGAKQQEA